MVPVPPRGAWASSGKKNFLVVDRSPYSSVFYTRGSGAMFRPIIDELVKEMRMRANVHIYTVCLLVERGALWKRITQRLQTEPLRRKFGEDSRKWMDKICQGYETFDGWNATVRNDEGSNKIGNLVASIVRFIAARTGMKVRTTKGTKRAPVVVNATA